MARLLSLLSLVLLVTCVSDTIAAPACSRKNRQTKACIQACKSNLGWFGKVTTPTSTPEISSSLSTTSTSTTPSPSTSNSTTTSTAVPVSTPPAGTSGGSSGGTSPADIQAYLSGHNSIRAQHSATNLTWSDALASKAQQWANGCKFQHSGGSLGPYGENLAAGTGSAFSIQTAIKLWTDEASQYDPSNPQPSHFTQVVWKSTTQVGCAVQSCDGIFDPSYGKANYYVCEYSPAGNVIGEFSQNVQP